MNRFFIYALLLIPFCLLQSEAIREINFEGNDTYSKKELLKQLTIREKKMFRKGMTYNKEEVRLEKETIIQFYQENGFLFVEVEVEAIKQNKNRIDLNFKIAEHDDIKISKINKKMNNEQARIIDKLELPFSAGDRFTEAALYRTITEIKEKLLENGYHNPKINFELTVNEVENEVEITLLCENVPKTIIQNFRIIGNQEIKEKRILSVKSVDIGDEFQLQKLKIYQKNLMKLNCFEYAIVRYENDVLNIRVKERPKWGAEILFGYGIEEKIRAGLKMTRFGFFRPIDKTEYLFYFSSLKPYKIEMKITHPVFFHINSSFSQRYFSQKEITDTYVLKSYGLDMKADYFSDVNNYYSGYIFDKNKIDLEDNVDDTIDDYYNKSTLYFGFARTTSTPDFFPTSGYSFTTHLALGGFLQNELNYIKPVISLKNYRSISSRFTIALRQKIGFMKKIWGAKKTPIEQRFYSGGSTSNRGWKTNHLGPKNSEEIPVGGHSLLEMNIEIRFMIRNPFYGVLFYDAGNVWNETTDIRVTDLRSAYGAGLRVATPIGPIRLDFALSEFYDFQFYLNIGQAF